MADETLLLLAKEIRGKTLKSLDGLSDEQVRFAAPGLNNPILWHAGHALIVNEHLGVSPATGKPPLYPQGWFELFSWASKPTATTKWPSLAEVTEKLRDQLERLTTAIRALPPERMDEIVDREKNRTMRFSILHGLHDEAIHQGEIHLLKKMRAKQ